MNSPGTEDPSSHIEALFSTLRQLQHDLSSSASESRRSRMAEALANGLAALELEPSREDALLVALRERLVQAAEDDYRDATEFRKKKNSPAAPDPELERLRSENLRLVHELKIQQQGQGVAQARQQQLEKSLASLRAENDRLQPLIEDLQRRRDQDQAALNSARQKWQSAEDAREAAASERDALKGAVARAETRITELRDRVKALESELAELPTGPAVPVSAGPSPFAARLRETLGLSLEPELRIPADAELSQDDLALIWTCAVLASTAITQQQSIDALIQSIIFGEDASRFVGFDRTRNCLIDCLASSPGAVERLRATIAGTIEMNMRLAGAYRTAIKRGAPGLLERLAPEEFPVAGFVRNHADSWRKLQDLRSELLHEDLYALFFEEPLRDELKRIESF